MPLLLLRIPHRHRSSCTQHTPYVLDIAASAFNRSCCPIWILLFFFHFCHSTLSAPIVQSWLHNLELVTNDYVHIHVIELLYEPYS